jgi:hypothetical protein
MERVVLIVGLAESIGKSSKLEDIGNVTLSVSANTLYPLYGYFLCHL